MKATAHAPIGTPSHPPAPTPPGRVAGYLVVSARVANGRERRFRPSRRLDGQGSPCPFPLGSHLTENGRLYGRPNGEQQAARRAYVRIAQFFCAWGHARATVMGSA